MSSSQEISLFLGMEPDLFEGDTSVNMFSGFGAREYKAQQKIEKIIADDTLDERAKIDAIAQTRGWFHGDTAWVDAYLAGEVSLVETVERKAAPVDESYTTADHGTKYYSAEQFARNQRQYWSPEQALAMWGAEQDFLEPDQTSLDKPSSEGQLWGLWYTILHASKRIPWQQDEAQQTKLLALVQAFKARPDPPLPSPMTVALKREWIWETGVLWSGLVLLGASARETWNDACGCGAGWTGPEVRAWTNVNAFVARLTATETWNFALYGTWALRDLEEDREESKKVKRLVERSIHKTASAVVILSCEVQVAAVWVEIAGRQVYEFHLNRSDDSDGDHKNADDEADVNEYEVDASLRGHQLPWARTNATDSKTQSLKWRFWQRRFEQEANNERLADNVREQCRRAAEKMHALGSEKSAKEKREGGD